MHVVWNPHPMPRGIVLMFMRTEGCPATNVAFVSLRQNGAAMALLAGFLFCCLRRRFFLLWRWFCFLFNLCFGGLFCSSSLCGCATTKAPFATHRRRGNQFTTF